MSKTSIFRNLLPEDGHHVLVHIQVRYLFDLNVVLVSLLLSFFENVFIYFEQQN